MDTYRVTLVEFKHSIPRTEHLLWGTSFYRGVSIKSRTIPKFTYSKTTKTQQISKLPQRSHGRYETVK